MYDQMIKAIVDLINTSPDHKAWYDMADISASSGLYIIGLLVSSDDNLVRPITIDGATIHLGSHIFDLNDPKSIEKIEKLFECSIDSNVA